MDEEVREGFQPARWLAWATVALLAAGVVSVGAVSGSDGPTGQEIVTAAGTGADGVEVPPAGFVPPPPPPPPSTTTAPQAPVPAPTVTSPPTVVTAPPTTQPVRTTSTTRAPAAAPTTVTTAPTSRGKATVTVVNQHPEAVVATVNGHVFELASGQQSAPVEMTLAPHDSDVIGVELRSDRSCGTGDAGPYFPAGGRYRLTVTAGPGMCRNAPGPQVTVTPA